MQQNSFRPSFSDKKPLLTNSTHQHWCTLYIWYTQEDQRSLGASKSSLKNLPSKCRPTWYNDVDCVDNKVATKGFWSHHFQSWKEKDHCNIDNNDKDDNTNNENDDNNYDNIDNNKDKNKDDLKDTSKSYTSSTSTYCNIKSCTKHSSQTNCEGKLYILHFLHL